MISHTIQLYSNKVSKSSRTTATEKKMKLICLQYCGKQFSIFVSKLVEKYNIDLRAIFWLFQLLFFSKLFDINIIWTVSKIQFIFSFNKQFYNWNQNEMNWIFDCLYYDTTRFEKVNEKKNFVWSQVLDIIIMLLKVLPNTIWIHLKLLHVNEIKTFALKFLARIMFKHYVQL